MNLSALKTPGVYIEEVSLLPPSVVGVETGIPAFVGYTDKTVDPNGDDLILKPTRITSFREFEAIFGGPQIENDGLKIKIEDIVEKVEADEAKDKLISRQITAKVDPASNISKHILYYSMQLYFSNGGGPCYIVTVGKHTAGESPVEAKLTEGVKAIEQEDEPTLIVVPEAILIDDFANGAVKVYEAALNQAGKLQDRFVIMDVQQKKAVPGSATFTSDVNIDAAEFRKFFNENAKYGAAYYPYLDTTIDFSYSGDGVVIEHIRKTVAGGDEKEGKYKGKKLESELKTSDNLLYNLLLSKLTSVPMKLPPSAAIAGIYAKTDAERGVWKAPANVGVLSVIGPNIKIDDELQKGLNVHDSGGKSINVIRSFSGRGTLVWGARTLDGNSNEWRYINVRRFFNFVEESVKKATFRFVFEPNDANTWVSVRAMIENFLTLQWRAGALQGAKPEQAFFVRVGLGQTMSADDIFNGRLIVEIGMAVVRPAEFIILRFSHKVPEA